MTEFWKVLIAPTITGVVSGLIVAFIVWRITGKKKRSGRKLKTTVREKERRRERKVITGGGLAGFLLGFVIALGLWSGSGKAEPLGKAVLVTGDFLAQSFFHPSGMMGDIGDITIERRTGVDRFTYDVRGKGPHEWEYKYVKCRPDSLPARFAGVMYLNPPNNFGEVEDGGYDLRRFHRLKWEARCITGEVNVEFVAGGVNWKWNDTVQCPKKEPTPYPCSLPRTSLGIKRLTEAWQSFEYEFTAGQEKQLRRLVGGFAWVIAASSNGVTWDSDRSAPNVAARFTIELRNIHYERN